MQVYLVGNQGESKANDSVRSVRQIVDSAVPPPGVKAYVTGAAALTADQSAAGEKGIIKVTIITFIVIIVMLLFVYRSIVTVFITLLMVFIELFAARQVVAFLAYNNIIGLSTFAVNLLVLMAIAAGTDMRSLSWADIKRRGRSVRTGNKPSTPCSTGPRTWFWALA